MGVMECNRAECSNILCDRYSSKYGYICHECFDELVKLGYNTDINSFMNTKKENMIDGTKEDPFKKFDSIFPLN